MFMRKCPRGDRHLKMGREGSGDAAGETGRGASAGALGFGAEVVLQYGSVLGHHHWAFLSHTDPPPPPAISLCIPAALALGAQGIPEGLKAAAGALPQGEGAYIVVKDRNNE